MSVLNTLFDKIFVLTIARNADRHTSVKKHLQGIDFDLWYGIDVPQVFPDATCVREIPNEFFTENNIDKSFVSAWTKGQLGAYTSITKMIQKVSEEYDQALIFEDDFISVREDWQQILCKAVKELPDGWDILLVGYLYYGRAYKWAYGRRLRWIFNIFNTIKKYLSWPGAVKATPKKYSSHLDKSGAALGGHAYALSKKGAKKLMQHLNPMQMTGDILVKKLIEDGELNAYSVYPCLFKQNELFGSKTDVL